MGRRHFIQGMKIAKRQGKCHTCKGGPVNMKAGVAGQTLDVECPRPASRTNLLIYREQGCWPLGGGMIGIVSSLSLVCEGMGESQLLFVEAGSFR